MGPDRAAGTARARYVLVVSEPDPVASAAAERWGSLPATGDHVEGTALRELADGVLVLRRPGHHVHDDHLDARLPASLRADRPPLVFPSIHRSESNRPCLTVHPLGNPGSAADVGGAPGVLTPTAPRLMVDALRRLSEGGTALGVPTAFEATHHGPSLDSPAFFAEIGYGEEAGPSHAAVSLLATTLSALEEDPKDRVALGIGGGHYAPHFTELALSRHWAFGHLLSRHSLTTLGSGVARTAWDQTPGADGILAARAADYAEGEWSTIAPRRSDGEAPRR